MAVCVFPPCLPCAEYMKMMSLYTYFSSWYKHKVSGLGLWPHLKGFSLSLLWSASPGWDGHSEGRKAGQCPTIALSTSPPSSVTAALTRKTTLSLVCPLSPFIPLLPWAAFESVSCLEPSAPVLISVLHICLNIYPHNFGANCSPRHPRVPPARAAPCSASPLRTPSSLFTVSFSPSFP